MNSPFQTSKSKTPQLSSLPHRRNDEIYTNPRRKENPIRQIDSTLHSMQAHPIHLQARLKIPTRASNFYPAVHPAPCNLHIVSIRRFRYHRACRSALGSRSRVWVVNNNNNIDIGNNICRHCRYDELVKIGSVGRISVLCEHQKEENFGNIFSNRVTCRPARLTFLSTFHSADTKSHLTQSSANCLS